MRKLSSLLLLAFQNLWWWLRQVSGDAAYDNYLHSQRTHPHTPSSPMTPSAFYRDSLRRRYSTINRCC